MMLPKLTGLTAIVVLLAGCSSPPEPAAVDWSQPAQPVTTTQPSYRGLAGDGRALVAGACAF